MTPLASIATIDDLIVTLLRLGIRNDMTNGIGLGMEGLLKIMTQRRKEILFVFGKYLALV